MPWRIEDIQRDIDTAIEAAPLLLLYDLLQHIVRCSNPIFILTFYILNR